MRHFACFTALAVLFSTGSAFGSTPNFAALTHVKGFASDVTTCVPDAWAASGPTQAQNDQVGTFIDQATQVFDAHKGAVETELGNLVGVWTTQPIVKANVLQEVAGVAHESKPIADAALDAVINSLNLLNADQRSKFDASFFDCLGKVLGGTTGGGTSSKFELKAN